MTDTHPTPRARAAAPGRGLTPPSACAYCASPIDPRWYFCVRCATPWADPDLVVRPVRPIELTAGQLVREKVPVVWTLFWTYAVVVFGGSILAWVAMGDDEEVLRVTLVDAAILATTCWFGAVHWRSLRPQLGRPGFSRWEAWVGIAALVPLLAVGWGWHEAMEAAGFVSRDPFREMREAGLSDAAVIGIACVLPAVTEEIAFRGLLQHWLHAAVEPRTAIGLASVLFAALHLSIVSFPYLLLAGVVLGWMKHRTGSLYPSMLLHFLHNLAVIEILPG